MTKFEQVGINYQYSADNKEDALRKFQYSCNCCCTRGMHINCDHCAIAVAHNLVIALNTCILRRNNHEYV